MIKIIDDLTPEDLAMLQALYSRSPASVDDHLEKVKRVGSGAFVQKYLVGYGHQSIGDCGTTTLFIEGVTMLAAKAIQDWPLYSGQEASTRYMDFSNAVFHNPLGTPEGEQIQEAWRSFYLKAREPVLAHLRAKYVRQDSEDTKSYEGAIAARSFDILRAFLPAGASTNLSWHTNLRQASDRLNEMIWHPDPEISKLAQSLLQALSVKYPHSFRVPSAASQWNEQVIFDHHLFAGFRGCPSYDEKRLVELDTTILKSQINAHIVHCLHNRPRGAMVPRHLAELGHICSEFYLDFGSFRDLQRHRNGVVRMPLLETVEGFHKWYLAELPPVLAVEAIALIEEQTKRIEAVTDNVWTRQSYIAMGFLVPCRVTQSLPAFVYRVELRSSKTVHPTLRAIVLEEIELFKALFPDIPLHVDTDPDSWTVRRGGQTITEKT